MSDVILCNISDANEVVEEARLEWIYSVLDALNVPEDVLDFEDIREYRYNMEEFGIEVELMTNGNVNVYKKQWHDGEYEEYSGWLPTTEDHLVAQWKTPKYVRKAEGKDVYYEIHLNEWSILNMR
jgi:hypothetical protein